MNDLYKIYLHALRSALQINKRLNSRIAGGELCSSIRPVIAKRFGFKPVIAHERFTHVAVCQLL